MQPDAVTVFQGKELQGLQAPLDDVVLQVIAQAVQGQDGVEHGRLDAGPVAAVLLVFQDPFFRLA